MADVHSHRSSTEHTDRLLLVLFYSCVEYSVFSCYNLIYFSLLILLYSYFVLNICFTLPLRSAGKFQHPHCSFGRMHFKLLSSFILKETFLRSTPVFNNLHICVCWLVLCFCGSLLPLYLSSYWKNCGKKPWNEFSWAALSPWAGLCSLALFTGSRGLQHLRGSYSNSDKSEQQLFKSSVQGTHSYTVVTQTGFFQCVQKK